uniref:Uncharacterized protein n=1 Tax=Arundo donax TaxID=35708 RepID=A0A0A9ALF6_ARUDO
MEITVESAKDSSVTQISFL